MKFNAAELLELCKADGGKLRVADTPQAYAFGRALAHAHYENFPVGSLLIPRRLREHFYAVYAFARVADDIADEEHSLSVAERLHALNELDALLGNTDAAARGNPVFRALAATRRALAIPVEPFRSLLRAFRADVLFTQAENWQDLEQYCRNSANPVGELVLRIFGLYTPARAQHSDAICTGLQLANFWQDLSVDIPRMRCYIPLGILKKHGIDAQALHCAQISANFRRNLDLCLQELYKRTQDYFCAGTQLLAGIPDTRLRLELAVTIQGGMRILEKSRKLGCNILHNRPTLSKMDYCGIGLAALSALFRTRTTS